MSSIPSLLSDLGEGLALRWRHFRLDREGAAQRVQRRQLRDLLQPLSQTEFGRTHGLGPGMPWKRFQTDLPLRTEPLGEADIRRLRENAPGLLWPYSAQSFLQIMRFDGGVDGFLPVPPEFERHLRRTWREGLLMLSNRETTPSCLHAPVGLFEHLNRPTPQAETLPRLIERLTMRKKATDAGYLALLGEPEILDPGIATETPLRWLVSLAPLFRMDGPRIAMRFGTECIVHEVAATAAGIFAVQDRPKPGEGMRLLLDDGLFYEFLPLADYSPGELPRLGTKTLRVEELKPGVDALLFITSPSGACRFSTGEIVRFVTKSPPRIQRMGRVDALLPLAGEWMTERTLADALSAVCVQRGWEIVHLHVAPHGPTSLTGQSRGAHEWWIELKPGSRQTPTGPMIADMIDAELSRQQPGYAERRRAGKIHPPLVRLLIPGVFDAWRNRCHDEHGVARLPVSLPDRRIADVLAKFARFHDS